jgi:hypothetical protein
MSRSYTSSAPKRLSGVQWDSFRFLPCTFPEHFEMKGNVLTEGAEYLAVK